MCTELRYAETTDLYKALTLTELYDFKDIHLKFLRLCFCFGFMLREARFLEALLFLHHRIDF